MSTVTLEEVNNNILSLKKEVDELKEIVQKSNRQELAEKARRARLGEGNWHKLEA